MIHVICAGLSTYVTFVTAPSGLIGGLLLVKSKKTETVRVWRWVPGVAEKTIQNCGMCRTFHQDSSCSATYLHKLMHYTKLNNAVRHRHSVKTAYCMQLGSAGTLSQMALTS